MPSLDQQASPGGGVSHTARWIVVAAIVAAVAIGLVLLAIYGGGGGSGPGY